MTDNYRGAVLMTFSMAAFVLNDTFMKLALGSVPLFQAMTLRGLLTTALVAALCLAYGVLRVSLSRRDWTYVALRAFSEAGAAVFFLTALANMPIANLIAILQLLPLTVALGGFVFYGEAIGWRRALAIAVGFVGMILIVQPKANGFDINTTYALISVGFVTLRDLITRRMSKSVPSLFVTLTASFSVLALAAGLSLFQTWEPVSNEVSAYIGLAALIVSLGYLLSVMVMRVGDMAHVAFFRYTGLLWALLLGAFVFDEWPEPLVLLGAGLIVGAGAFTMWRERVVKARSATP